MLREFSFCVPFLCVCVCVCVCKKALLQQPKQYNEAKKEKLENVLLLLKGHKR